MSYQAIPHDSNLLKKAAESEWTTILLYSHGFNEIPKADIERYLEDKEFVEFKQEAERIRRNHSNIEKRKLYFGRRWDMLHYLLSEIRRNPQKRSDEHDLIHRAIHGGEKLGENSFLPQGVPVRFLNPFEVKEISKYLGNIEADELEKYWNPPLMSEAGVYKIHGDYNDDDQLRHLKEEFKKLKDFYLWAAIYDEAVLVFCD